MLFGRESAGPTDLAALENVIQAEQPDVVINAAAYTRVDQAHFEYTVMFNVPGSPTMADSRRTYQQITAVEPLD